MEKIRGKTLKEWKDYCKDDSVPIKTMKYICCLEEKLEQLKLSVISNNEVAVCDCGNKLTDKEIYFGQCLQCDRNVEE